MCVYVYVWYVCVHVYVAPNTRRSGSLLIAGKQIKRYGWPEPELWDLTHFSNSHSQIPENANDPGERPKHTWYQQCVSKTFWYQESFIFKRFDIKSNVSSGQSPEPWGVSRISGSSVWGGHEKQFFCQKACVLTSWKPCGTRCTFETCPKAYVFKTFHQKHVILYEVVVKSCYFVCVFECRFSKSICFLVGGTLWNQMHLQDLSKSICF